MKKEDYSLISKAELKLELKRLRVNLHDLEETMQFNSTYSSAHISGEQVKKYEESLTVLKNEIAAIEQILSQK
ncbi:MAG: hypothetical protein IBX72_09555 [Nitrospirae bacterium]|nr:hypothetical protein [Nitrospirota bacterium]